MRAADLVPYEKIHVVNINNGARFETYVIEGESGDKTICLNGAAARLGQVGDQVIIMSYSNVDTQEALDHEPTIVLLDENNNIVSETAETVTV